MQFGLTFLVDLYDFERDEELHVITMPGDYIRMSAWAKDDLKADDGETVTSLRRNYATAWQAFKRLGKLAEMGLPEELTMEAVDAMADRFSIYVNEIGEGTLPLSRGRGK